MLKHRSMVKVIKPIRNMILNTCACMLLQSVEDLLLEVHENGGGS